MMRLKMLLLSSWKSILGEKTVGNIWGKLKKIIPLHIRQGVGFAPFPLLSHPSTSKRKREDTKKMRSYASCWLDTSESGSSFVNVTMQGKLGFHVFCVNTITYMYNR